MKSIIKLINKILCADLCLDYQFSEWNGKLKFPFIVGEIEELENTYEDGKNEYLFILTLTDNNSSILNLLNIKEKIKTKFKYGYKENGIVISYGNSIIIPQEDENLKRIQINLKIKNWEI